MAASADTAASLVVQIARHRPASPCLPRPPNVAAVRRVEDPEDSRDLPVAPAESVLQPENISNPTHGQPRPGHRLPPRSRISLDVGRTVPCIKSSSTPPHPLASSAPTPRASQNDRASKWTNYVGISKIPNLYSVGSAPVDHAPNVDARRGEVSQESRAPLASFSQLAT